MSPDVTEAVGVFTDFMYSEVYKNPVAKGEESKVHDILLGFGATTPAIRTLSPRITAA